MLMVNFPWNQVDEVYDRTIISAIFNVIKSARYVSIGSVYYGPARLVSAQNSLETERITSMIRASPKYLLQLSQRV